MPSSASTSTPSSPSSARPKPSSSGFDLPDPVTIAYAIDPLIATAARRLHLAVETESELTRGMVVMDLLEFTDQPPNALVVTAADRDRFLEMLRTAIS